MIFIPFFHWSHNFPQSTVPPQVMIVTDSDGLCGFCTWFCTWCWFDRARIIPSSQSPDRPPRKRNWGVSRRTRLLGTPSSLDGLCQKSAKRKTTMDHDVEVCPYDFGNLYLTLLFGTLISWVESTCRSLCFTGLWFVIDSELPGATLSESSHGHREKSVKPSWVPQTDNPLWQQTPNSLTGAWSQETRGPVCFQQCFQHFGIVWIGCDAKYISRSNVNDQIRCWWFVIMG